MALVTVQRSPSPSHSSASVEDSQDGVLAGEEEEVSPKRSIKSKAALKKLKKLFTTIRFVHKLRFSENYFAVKGAALILPQSECSTRFKSCSQGQGGGDIHKHLQSMIYLLRPQDTIKVAVKLESIYMTRDRYLAVVATTGRQDTEESLLLGIDVGDELTTIGLVIPIWGDTKIRLDGDGGLIVTSLVRDHIFKPISVQAMWSALQSLNRMFELAAVNNYYPKGLTHTWVTYYEVRIKSNQSCMNEWNMMEDVESKRKDPELPNNKEEVEEYIKIKLREIMSQVDLEEVTTKYVRQKLEESLNMSLESQKRLIDGEMIIIMRQMDAPSQIFDFLYLGSEWNASNLEELKRNGVDYILNVTREIDNFYPDICEYCNIRVFDVEQAELLKYWDKTYKFIKRAKHHHSKVLVHCKMGVSRSASTVIAFAMKEFGWSLDEAMNYVKSKRGVINPNKGFRKQLVTYEGILDASKHRHNMLWRSVSESDLTNQQLTLMSDSEDVDHDTIDTLNLDCSRGDYVGSRPRSWSPTDRPTDILMKARKLASDADSSEEEVVEDNLFEFTNLPVDSEIGFNMPIPLTMEQLEEYEMSSRSADSLDIDEAFLDCDYDQFDHQKGLPVISFRGGPVVLLNLRELEDTEGHLLSPTQVNEISEESDFEDYQSERKQAGFYDIAMLTDPNEELFEITEEEQDIYHPDVKLEIAQSQYKKNFRIAKVLMLQQKENENQKTLFVKSSGLKKKKLNKTQSASQLGAPKLRPDDFWIKDIPTSPKDEHSDNTCPIDVDIIPEMNIEGVCETESSTDIPVVTSSGNNASENISNKADIKNEETFLVKLEFNIPGNSDVSEELKNEETTQQTQITVDVTPETDTNTSEREMIASSSHSTSKEVGIWQHYDKEAIPWCPGTVKRTTLEMEEKSKEVSVSSMEEKVCGLSQSLPSPCDSPVHKHDTPDNIAKDEVIIKISESTPELVNLQHARSSIQDVSAKLQCEIEPQTVRPSTLDFKKSIAAENEMPDNLNRRNSVYEIEEIRLEPDIVRRIKKEIENRERSCSYSESEGSMCVQRSSSWKLEKKPVKSRFDRNSTRRRTILPVIRRSPSREIPISPNEATDIKMVKIKDEVVTLKQGQVQKQRKEYEDTSLNIPTRDRETRSASPFIDDSILICAGSVKKQKEHLETKYGNKSNCDIDTKAAFTPVLCIYPSSETTTPKDEDNNNYEKSLKSVSLSSANDLSPAIEKVLKKSPSLSRKRKQIEVIACHTPEVFEDSPNISSPETVSNSTLISVPKYQTSQQNPSQKASKVRLSKSISVPTDMQCVNLSHQLMKEDSKPTTITRGVRSKTLSSVDDNCLKRYVNEGIEWNTGTVRQQMKVIESKAKESDSENLSPCSKAESFSRKIEVASIEKQSEKETSHDNNTECVSNVQKIRQEIETNAGVFHPKMSAIERTKSCSLERKHSLGSRTDFSRKKQSFIDSTNVGRSSSFKESSPTKFDCEREFSEKSLNQPRHQQSSVKKQDVGINCETMIASHSPTTVSAISSMQQLTHKCVVIIPKPEVKMTETSQPIVDTKPGCDNIVPLMPSMLAVTKSVDEVKVKDIVGRFEASPELQSNMQDQPKSRPVTQVTSSVSVEGLPAGSSGTSVIETKKKLKHGKGQKSAEKNTAQTDHTHRLKKLHGKTHPLAKLSKDTSARK